MEDWQVMKEIIAAVRQAIPDASSKPPGAVLEHVLGALQAVEAKIINCSENVSSMHSSPSEDASMGHFYPTRPGHPVRAVSNTPANRRSKLC